MWKKKFELNEAKREEEEEEEEEEEKKIYKKLTINSVWKRKKKEKEIC